MCWTSYSKPEIKTAEEDISIFKILKFNNDKPFSYYKNFEYIIDKEYSIKELKVEKVKYSTQYNPSYEIEEGFHSYSMDCKEQKVTSIQGYSIYKITYKDCYIASYFVPCIKVLGIIPKGANYYLNEFGEYVSNKIKICNIDK